MDWSFLYFSTVTILSGKILYLINKLLSEIKVGIKVFEMYAFIELIKPII